MRVLVLVEDDLMIARSLIRVFTRMNYAVRHFPTVGEARVHLSEYPTPDVLVLDRQVGWENGWALRDEVGPGVRVVLMTGAEPTGNKLTFYHKGVENIQKLRDMVEGKEGYDNA